MTTEPPLPAALSGYPEPFNDTDLDMAQDGVVARALPTWKPTDDAGAEWAMRKLAETTAAGRPIAEQATRWRERIDEWEQRETATIKRRAEFFQRLLQTYGLEQRAETDGKRKTVNLPSGTISTRGSEHERVMVDIEKFLACMATAPPHIREVLTRTQPKPISEIRRLISVYTRTACRSCGDITTRNDGEIQCPACGSFTCEVIETFAGIPKFGLTDPPEAGPFRLEGISFGPPSPPSASVALADERALPRVGEAFDAFAEAASHVRDVRLPTPDDD